MDHLWHEHIHSNLTTQWQQMFSRVSRESPQCVVQWTKDTRKRQNRCKKQEAAANLPMSGCSLQAHQWRWPACLHTSGHYMTYILPALSNPHHPDKGHEWLCVIALPGSHGAGSSFPPKQPLSPFMQIQKPRKNRAPSWLSAGTFYNKIGEF